MLRDKRTWHHYVPKCHLRHWRRLEIPEPEVFFVKKSDRIYYSTNFKNIFREKHLYSLAGQGSPDPLLEKEVFCGIDGRAAGVISRLDFHENYRTSSVEDTYVSHFLLASLFRKPWDIKKIGRKILPKIKRATREHDGIDLSGIPFLHDECRKRFRENDADYIAANSTIIGICNHILFSDQSKDISRWPRFVYKLKWMKNSFITGDEICIKLREGRSVIIIAPISRKTCIVMAERPDALLDFTRDEHSMCYAVNEGLWSRARHAVVGDPTAPFLNELGLVRGDPGRP